MRALLLIDHGSRRADANAIVERVAALLRATHPGLIVVAAHMELAPPGVAEGLRACVARGADEVVAVPYFLGPGRHAGEDVPRLVTEAASEHPSVSVRLSEPLGAHALIAALVAHRAGLDAG